MFLSGRVSSLLIHRHKAIALRGIAFEIESLKAKIKVRDSNETLSLAFDGTAIS